MPYFFSHFRRCPYIRRLKASIMTEFVSQIAAGTGFSEKHIAAVLSLFEEGATVPFIARYRKDRTGAMDEVQIQFIREESKRLEEFTERRGFIETTISSQGKMTDELQAQLAAATTLNELEDIYLPYKPKRKTRAQAAREKGLLPLAEKLLAQEDIDPEKEAAAYLQEQVASETDALQGARDIIAEIIHEHADTRTAMRKLFEEKAAVQSQVLPEMEEKGIKYRDYFSFSEPVSKIPSHRMLALLRGFMEGILRITITPPEEKALALLEKKWIQAQNPAAEQVRKAIKDAWKRLLQPSMETECRSELKLKSDEEAIRVFSENLRQLLLSPPLGEKRVLAIDPGYKTGCKVVCIDEKGSLLHTGLIYIHENNHKKTEAEHTIRQLILEYHPEVFAIGDGTAGRETEQFIKGLQTALPVFLVNEDGASIYSASETAREEFPDQDITVRGAISIGRRLMDPLAELVKIDPKSIGVGQYQHDVNQVRLKEKLDQTVISCVNNVGVNLNTASRHLLSYVSGIGPSLADNIVRYREEHGMFKNRKALLSIPRLGEKAYEQCAGFLRIRGGDHPLDGSAVHPEAYGTVEKMASDLGVGIHELVNNEDLIRNIKIDQYVTEALGRHTIEDILSELRKPGRDPRDEAQLFEFAAVYKMEDLEEGMVLPGIVTNITRFGAFVDIGVKQDGLVHVSEIAHRYISDPGEALKLNQKVQVKVISVDKDRKRIALSIKQATPPPVPAGKKIHKKEKAKPQQLEDALHLLKEKFTKK